MKLVNINTPEGEEEARVAASLGKEVVMLGGGEAGIYEAPVHAALVPEAVTPWQIRKALNALGLRAAVEAAVAAGPQDLKDGWEFATEVRRDDQLVVAMGAALGKSAKELDDLFALAATL